MNDISPFFELLQNFIGDDGRAVRAISRKTHDIFGEGNGVSHENISRWLRGDTKKPRFWEDIVKVAIALNLNASNIDKLLVSARHEPVADLRKKGLKPKQESLLNMIPDDQPLPVPEPDSPPFQAKRKLSYFVGRETLIKKTANLITKSKYRLICLYGIGGVGKTSLAIHLAYLVRESFRDGVLWADIDKSDTMVIAQNFAESYGENLEIYPDVESRSAKLREVLAKKQALIILDDVQSDDQVRPLLPPNGDCVVLMTTRRRDLTVADEGYKQEVKLFSSGENGEAIALFKEIVGNAYVDRESHLFERLATMLDYHPLALATAISIFEHEYRGSLAEFIEELEEGDLSDLARGDMNVEGRFDASFKLLEPDQQTFFTQIACFVGNDFSKNAAAYLAGWSFRKAGKVLKHLARLSLIQATGKARYQMHALLREYGQMKVTNQQATHERLIAYFVQYVLDNTENDEALRHEEINLLAFFDLALRTNSKQLIPGIVAIFPYLKQRGLYEKATEYLEMARSMLILPEDREKALQILTFLADIKQRKGLTQEAVVLYESALEEAQLLDDKGAFASRILTSLGAVAHQKGRLEQAHTLYSRGIEIAQKNGDSGRLISLQINLGLVAAGLGNSKEAERLYTDALAGAKELGDEKLSITALQNLGVLLLDLGDYKQAKRYLDEGVSRADDFGDPLLISRLRGNLGMFYLNNNQPNAAKEAFEKALNKVEKIHVLQTIRVRTNLGMVNDNLGKLYQTDRHFKDALALAEEHRYGEDICRIHNYWGESYLTRGELQKAFDHLEQAQIAAKKLNLRNSLAFSLYGLARIAGIRENVIEARRLGEESQDIFRKASHKMAEEVNSWLRSLPTL